MVQTFVGKVTSDKMMKSVVVTVTYLRKLPKYHVWRRFQSKIMAHDALDECHTGDTVQIRSSRPLSKRKSFVVTKLISRAPQYDEEAQRKAKVRSAQEALTAEERRHALANELMSRRQFLDQRTIELAKKEIEERKPEVDLYSASVQAVREKWYTEPTFPLPGTSTDDSTEAPSTPITRLGETKDPLRSPQPPPQTTQDPTAPDNKDTD